MPLFASVNRSGGSRVDPVSGKVIPGSGVLNRRGTALEAVKQAAFDVQMGRPVNRDRLTAAPKTLRSRAEGALTSLLTPVMGERGARQYASDRLIPAAQAVAPSDPITAEEMWTDATRAWAQGRPGAAAGNLGLAVLSVGVPKIGGKASKLIKGAVTGVTRGRVDDVARNAAASLVDDTARKQAAAAKRAAATARERELRMADRAVQGNVLAGADNPNMISTRRPSRPNYPLQGNPDQRLMIQSSDALRSVPEAFRKNMLQLRGEPFMTGVTSRSPEKILQEGVRRGADNLKFITNELMDPNDVDAARHWYETAQKLSERVAGKAGLPPEAGYGIMAVLSPQTPWHINVARAERMADMWHSQFALDPKAAVAEIQKRLRLPLKEQGSVARQGTDYINRIAETPFSELKEPYDRFARVSLADATTSDPMVRDVLPTGEYGDPYGSITWGSGDVINKAVNIFQDPTYANIAAQMEGGGKVPSFFNNIANPWSRQPISTIDTHSAGAASLFPGGGDDPIVYRAMGLSAPKGGKPTAASSDITGTKGIYGPMAEMHTLAGQEMGMLPREVQSVTWEGVRRLWGQEEKTDALKSAIIDIHRTSRTPEEARYRIADLLGKPVRRVYGTGR